LDGIFKSEIASSMWHSFLCGSQLWNKLVSASEIMGLEEEPV